MMLVTGGAGYIGSHTVVQLLNSGQEVMVLDNLSNSKFLAIDKIEKITRHRPKFVQGDIRDRNLLKKIFSDNLIQSVIHFAALKAVGESVSHPLNYYENNVSGTIILLEEMNHVGVKKIIFSSSATVYGNPHYLPCDELHPTSPTNPYGQTKLIIENILKDLVNADKNWSVGLLRYFNPVGAHISGLIGEDPSGIPNNLTPYISQVAIGKRQKLFIFGDNYDTIDGTGVRDYIHVEDLASGHLAALNYLNSNLGLFVVNLGTGKGTSVLELIKAFERASGKKIPYQVVDRRPGDLASVFAKTDLARELLGWTAIHDINQMCQDSWRWQSLNPNGLESNHQF
jgi:UDP-glucose 4-epimerase